MRCIAWGDVVSEKTANPRDNGGHESTVWSQSSSSGIKLLRPAHVQESRSGFAPCMIGELYVRHHCRTGHIFARRMRAARRETENLCRTRRDSSKDRGECRQDSSCLLEETLYFHRSFQQIKEIRSDENCICWAEVGKILGVTNFLWIRRRYQDEIGSRNDGSVLGSAVLGSF